MTVDDLREKLDEYPGHHTVAVAVIVYSDDEEAEERRAVATEVRPVAGSIVEIR
jgi:hypothetical protein